MNARESIVRVVVKHPWLTAGGLATVMGIGAALVVVSGIMPIKASSGHWTITARILDFAKLRSVATHSLGIQAPPLDDEALVLRGAAHYESGCASCHGKPGTRVPRVMAAMTPEPPELQAGLSRYTPEQLFSIVKHGIKFTGMPAWPAQERDDEVWAVVAFLRRMPTLDAATYERLAQGEPGATTQTGPLLPIAGEQPAPRVVRDTCWRCHGVDGTGRDSGAFPSLAGQRSEYLYASLRAFAGGTRFSGIMSSVAGGLNDGTMREVAAYYEQLPPREGRSGDASAIMRGATIAARGVPARDIPACGECHGPSDAPTNPAYPRLSGQHVRYLTSQLDLLKTRRRGGTINVNLMHVFVDRVTADVIGDVTLYYAAAPK
jgi:cytochrome c553